MERPDAHHHHHLSTHGRLRHLVHPHGRHVHIAQSPTEANDLRKSFSVSPSVDQDALPREVLLHGSEEHLQTLREIHNQLEADRARIRANHGACDELEVAILELHALSSELKRIERATQNLDAAVFGKYGYSTNIRTHNDQESKAVDTITTPNTIADWHAQRHQGDSMRFFRKPILRQYFHNNLLWRAANSQEVASYELFLDLIYVGIIAICGDNASENADGKSLLRFVITFIVTWKIWQELCTQVNWFDANDTVRRYYVLLNLACLLGVATNIEDFWEHGYTPLVGFYLAARFSQILYYLWHAYWLPFVRYPIILIALLILIPSALWIASIHVEQYTSQALIWLAIVIDLGAPGVTAGIMFRKHRLPTRWQTRFAFFPALNIEHRIERVQGFVSLVFGYSVVATIYQNQSAIGVTAFFGKAVLGLSQAFAFGSIYFEMDSFNLHQHAIRRHAVTAFVWNIFHLPFILGFVLAGAALARLVLTADSANASLSMLARTSESKAEERVSQGIRWFYCAGLAVALASMTTISLTHSYRGMGRGCSIFPKRARLVFRYCVSVVFLLLGLVHGNDGEQDEQGLETRAEAENPEGLNSSTTQEPGSRGLNSLQLIGITTSLIVLVVTVEIVGNIARDPGVSWWRCCLLAFGRRREGNEKGEEEGEQKCTYFAKDLGAHGVGDIEGKEKGRNVAVEHEEVVLGGSSPFLEGAGDGHGGGGGGGRDGVGDRSNTSNIPSPKHGAGNSSRPIIERMVTHTGDDKVMQRHEVG